MTAVAAVALGHKVHFAADSFCGTESVLERAAGPKIITLDKGVVVGVCGTFRPELVLTQVLKKALKEKKKLSEDWFLDKLPVLLWEGMVDTGIMRDNDGEKALQSSGFLVGWNGKLFYVEHDLCLWAPNTPYAAIGSGREMCLGSLATSHALGQLEVNPELTVRNAVYAASIHCPSVCGPFDYVAR